MINLTIAGRTVVMGKFFSANDAKSALEGIGGVQSVLFVDTPSTQFLAETIEILKNNGVKCVVRDHHDCPEPRNPREEQIRDTAIKVRELVDDAVISTREKHPACSLLMSIGEFTDVDAVIADPDPDGLLGTMKALGIVYPELDSDSAVLDGGRANQTRENLSDLAFKLIQGMAALPEYNPKRPEIAEGAKAELFTQFAKATQGDEEAVTWLNGKVEAYEALIAKTEEIISTVSEVISGVQTVDISRAGKIHLQTLASHMESQPNCMVTVVKKDVGPICSIGGFSHQFSLAVPRANQAEVNLQNFLPEGFISNPKEGIISNTTFLLHVSGEVWEEQVFPALKSRFSG